MMRQTGMLRPLLLAPGVAWRARSRVFSAQRAKKSLPVRRVRGTRDFLQQEAQLQDTVVQKLAQTVMLYGFDRIQTPTMEHTDLFSRSLGDGSDIVMKEMYTFQDNSGNSLTLRPEGTAGVIRAILTNNLAYSLPQKLFYSGSMFRYERPQRGRYREFQQFGIEFVGSKSPTVDVEAISMALNALSALGIENKTSLEINSLGDAESRFRYREALETHFSKYKMELSADSQSRLARGSVLRILDSKSDIDRRFINDAPLLEDYLSVPARQRFDQVLDGLSALDIKLKWNPRLVRGLDYYSHTVFEILEKPNEPASKGGIAVLAGGCYDGLTESLGGPAVSCIGWAAGIDRLCLLYEPSECDERVSIAMVPIVTPTEENSALIRAKAMRLAERLRSQNHRVHFCHSTGSVKNQMKMANQLACSFAIILGGDEFHEQSVQIKNLKERKAERVPWSQLDGFFGR